MSTLRIACLQSAGHGRDVEANLAELDSAAAAAAAAGAELLVTPEMFVTGYDVGDVAELAALPLTGRVAAIAAARGIAVVAGLPAVLPGGGVGNMAVVVDDGGRVLASYAKAHLFGEIDRRFHAGEAPAAVFDHHGVRCAVMICFDSEFPESVRVAALAGAHVVLVPTANMHPYGAINEHVMWTRAWENKVHLAYVNRCGAEGRTAYVGRSRIIGPDGTELAAAGTGPDLVCATIDTDAVDSARAAFDYLSERRPALYGTLAVPAEYEGNSGEQEQATETDAGTGEAAGKGGDM
ncbi:nitrilase-related carbon-nitrogen hydrolase [Streptosporangium roseum]|uniref:Nitrilase/cyanide hydratase and apolipoprotein N-acyltransferase n=1 Tax=Streptosporangium roseum (strain ATCC 12428 / DSM 43021 / JCM 3005 / KCTC 9067 / NCIMB 10171 / NRRL 2505 / NI 9100) TaxID=479432 RepID=D2B8M8_STRRD|nr:nitrilase-related carbon-nitrogen hydrolase [Streptosporangium roseum]ACZ87838.1 nitrilase/cyanide hydratase and apolipoprotein N- acyltransferase [Streptosporangium roseum DSM 43021]